MICIWLTRTVDSGGGHQWSKQTSFLQTSWNHYFMELKVQQVMLGQFWKIMLNSTPLLYDPIASSSLSYFLLDLLVTSYHYGLKAWKGTAVSCQRVQSLAQWADMKLLGISCHRLIEVQLKYLQNFKYKACILMRQNLELTTVVLYSWTIIICIQKISVNISSPVYWNDI